MIHYNDIDQGIRADCFALAVFAGMADRAPQLLSQILRQLPDGSFEVNLIGAKWKRVYSPSEVLSLGDNGADLSGDQDADGEYEIWPQLLELAYLEFTNEQGGTGNPPDLWFGQVSPVWFNLTGNFTASWDKQNQTIVAFMDQWYSGQGFPVVIDTLSSLPTGTTWPRDIRYGSQSGGDRIGYQLVGRHQYVFLGWENYTDPTSGVVTKCASLYNPWGVINPEIKTDNHENVLWIPVNELTSVVSNVWVLKEN